MTETINPAEILSQTKDEFAESLRTLYPPEKTIERLKAERDELLDFARMIARCRIKTEEDATETLGEIIAAARAVLAKLGKGGE